MSPDAVDVVRTHFDCKTRALKRGEPLVLERGELTMIADAIGRSVSHLHRLIKGERVSEHLRLEVERCTGWPLSLTVLPFAHRSAAA